MGDYDHLAGELVTPGQKGWLPLDEDGTPEGPATINPPVAPALACAVVAVELPDGGIGLQTPTGAPITDEMVPNSDFRVPGTGGTAPLPSPTLTSLEPNTAVSGDPDFTLHYRGTDFTENSIIRFAGQDEPTVFIDSTDITTIVKPSLFAPATVQCSVTDGGAETQSLDFEFTAPATSRRR